jgi:hypothetical protein
MPANRISASLSPTEQQDIMSAIATISKQLSFLVDLGPEERRAMTKLGDRNRLTIKFAFSAQARTFGVLRFR